ncbi:MAG: glycosyltransferase family 1 protein [Thermoanaerobacterales bacterium]|nr:glycosyltransferase family 1 protein [Thermoanaerobacterales bacterium]
MLRVAVDLTSQLTPLTGVGVMVDELVRRLARRDDLALTGFAVTWRGRGRLRDVVPPGVAVVDRPMAARPLHELWRRADHPRVDLWIGRHDVVWGPNFVTPPTRAAEVVTVHDLTFVHYPQLANEFTLSFPGLIRRALRRGAWVHTPSEFVRAEVVEHFGAPPERVVAIHHGVRPATGGDPARGRALAGGDRYVLAIGTVEPRKDLPTLVRAVDALAADDPDLRLVLAGADGWGAEALTAAVAAAAHGDRVVRLGRVDEADRAALLAGAAVLAFPSVYEGFGLPAVEAMAAGVPVVATRAGALPEVCGDGAVLVPVGDADALAEALGRVLADDAHRAALVERGRRVAARYDWDDTADAVAALLRRAGSPAAGPTTYDDPA